MSPPNTYTAIESMPYPDEDEDVFCVVCDGECTCGSANRASAARYDSPSPPTEPSLPSALPPSPVVVPRPTLKIKFSGKLLNKARHTPSSSASHGQTSKSLALKKLSRPSKPAGISRSGGKSALIAGGSSRSYPKPKPRPRPTKKANAVAAAKNKKNVNQKLKKASPWAAGSSSSDLTDLDAMAMSDDDDDLLAPPSRYPTFISASAIGSVSATDSSDSSDSSDFDSDSEMEKEEERYIIADERRQKERVRRELLGDDATQHTRSHNGGGDWEIKPRMRSVGPDDDADDADGDGDDSGAEEDADDEPDGEDDDEADEGGTDADAHSTFVGLATGWSEDEESGIDDADIFFANLSSHDDDDSADEDEGPPQLTSSTELPQAHRPPQVGLQITHGWDGEVVFTNGFMEGTSFTDADLAYLFASDSASEVQDTDEAMLASSDASDAEDQSMGSGEMPSDGETTEEELVDEDGLPTPAAMALFRPPTAVSVSAVNPLSTLSPAVRRVISPRAGERNSTNPAGILSGRVTFDNDSDEHDHDGLIGRRSRSASWASSSRSMSRAPRMGVFEPEQETPSKVAVIDGFNPDVPSPFRRRKSRNRSRKQSLISVCPALNARSRWTPIPFFSPSAAPWWPRLCSTTWDLRSLSLQTSLRCRK
jgi:hypothetical protein